MHDDITTGRSRTGLLGAVRIDLRRLHETWMSISFPRQIDYENTALGKWTPSTPGERLRYRLWSALGVLAVAVGYPFLLVGFATRFYASRLDSAATRLGVVGVLVLSVVVWGGLTVLARVRFSTAGFLAVLAASLVATVSAVLAVVFNRVGGRGTTVLLAYPLGVSAIFLPPVVAALYSPTVAAMVLPGSHSLAVWLLVNVLDVGGLSQFLQARFELVGTGYVLMWFAIAVPVGWALGLVVTLANYVRPR